MASGLAQYASLSRLHNCPKLHTRFSYIHVFLKRLYASSVTYGYPNYLPLARFLSSSTRRNQLPSRRYPGEGFR